MTRNQIEYAKHLEQRRSNRVQEDLTKKRDVRNFSYNLLNLQETARHNRATESLSRSSLDESMRSNLARERETARHNVALELEATRSNTARENEASRHNVATEQLQKYQSDQSYASAKYQADTSYASAQLSATVKREELASLDAYRSAQIGLEASQLGETNRSNVAKEKENIRSATAKERETNRHNVAVETEEARSNRARELETERHNRASERLSLAGTAVNAVGTAIRGVTAVAGAGLTSLPLQ